jgi:streptogramin lyase/signal transduction histidine kinase
MSTPSSAPNNAPRPHATRSWALGRLWVAACLLFAVPLARSLPAPDAPGPAGAHNLLGFETLAPFGTLLFRPLSHEMRLPAFSALAPVRDRYGYVWMALKGSGAARLEGLRSRSFNEPLELPSGKTVNNDWVELGLDRQGELWAFSQSGVFSKFNYQTLRFEARALLSAAAGYATTQPFVFDTQGQAWLMAVDGVWRIPASALRGPAIAVAEKVLDQRGTWRVDVLPSGKVLAIRKSEVTVLDPTSGQVLRRQITDSPALIDLVIPSGGKPTDPPARLFGPLHGEAAASVGFGESGLDRSSLHALALDPGDSLAAALQGQPWGWIFSTTKGTLWRAPELGAPLSRLSPKSGSLHALPEAGYYPGMIRSLGRDLWLSSRAAIYLSRTQTPGLIHLQPSQHWGDVLDKVHARTVARLLNERTLMLFDDTPNQFSLIRLHDGQIQAHRQTLRPGPGLLLGRSAAGTVQGEWVISGNGVDHGLWAFNPANANSMRRLPGTEDLQALTIQGLGQGIVLSSFRHELLWMPDLNSRPIMLAPPRLRGPLLKSYAGVWVPPGSAQRFWAFGPEGAIEVDLSTSQSQPLQFRCLAARSECELGGIQNLMQDRQGRLWVVASRGLFRAMEPGSLVFQPIVRRDGSPLAPLGEAVEDDQGRVWVNLQEGLVRVSASGEVTEFGAADDLPPGGSQLLKLPDGALLRVGRGALSIIDPQRFSPYIPDSPLNLNALWVDGRARDLGSTVTLAPGERKFTLEWSVQDYSDPSRNSVEHRLEGYEQHWTRLDATQAQISYENLAPGRYTLHVRGFSSRGDPLQTPAHALEVLIQPFWYQTWPFKLAMVAALLLCMSAAVAWRTARLRRHQAELTVLVRARTEALEQSNAQISRLLSHVRQAIFSVDAELRVNGACSQSCTQIFGVEPQGRPVTDLLCPDDPTKAQALKACLDDALAEPDLRRRSLFTSLAPSEYQRNGRVLRPEIVPLTHGFMFVVSDVTEQRELEQRVERERHRLDFILGALSGSEEFFGLIDEFQQFLAQGAQAWLPAADASRPPAETAGEPRVLAKPNLSGLYRALHTFKGSMAHLGFHHLPAALHTAEDHLRDHAQWGPDRSLQALRDVFAIDWQALLTQDLVPVTEVLGEDFVEQRGVVALTPQQADLLERVVSEYLQLQPDAPAAVATLASLRRIHLQNELRGHDKALQRMARSLGKNLQPLQIRGPALQLDNPRYRPWVTSLVHVLRNALDHGIEDPQIRYESDKPEAGLIECLIEQHPNNFTLEIRDDGAGIDPDALRSAACRKGLFTPEQAQSMSLEALLFTDGLSSRESANEWSGRGVGMAAVLQEVLALGGQLEVQNHPGRGCSVRMTLPLNETAVHPASAAAPHSNRAL